MKPALSRRRDGPVAQSCASGAAWSTTAGLIAALGHTSAAWAQTAGALSRDGGSERQLTAIAIVALVALAGVIVWNWTLRRTMRVRTRALHGALVEQQRLTDVIQSNEGRLALAMDVIGEGVWEWDLVADQIRASTRWAGSFGYRSDAPTSYATWMSFVHADDRDRVAAAMRAHIDGKTPRYESTYRVPRKGGEWIWVVDRGRIVRRDESGKPIRIIGALKDITMQLAAERALHEEKEAAEATSHAKSAFLAIVSHEMRTPLNAVIGAAALLERTDLNTDQRELLGLLKRSGDSLLAVVNDVLDFTKIEAGRFELDERPFDLRKTVREAVTLVDHAARQKELRVETRFADAAEVWLRGDDTRIRQILLNLLSNAVKFTSHGRVTVDVRLQPVADRPERRALHVAVADTGIGIPPDRLGRLFQPFSQVDSSTTRRFGGTGLGLAISRRLAELMGGTIDVATREGEGSTFTLRLECPLGEPPEAAMVAAPAAKAQSRALRVILAEDNPVNQVVQLRMLRQLGYDPAVVTNGIELLQAFDRTQYDLVLLDIQMPQMDGLEAARELRRRGFANLRIVALSADVTSETRDASREVGIDEYISKPLKLDVLASVLSRAETGVAVGS